MMQNDAEIDRIRAEYAVKTRKLEIRLDGLRSQIAQLTALATAGKTQIEQLHDELSEAQGLLQTREDELAEANSMLAALREQQGNSPVPEPGNVETPEHRPTPEAVSAPVTQEEPKSATRSEIEQRVAHLTSQLAKLQQAGAELSKYLEQHRLSADQAQNRASRLAEQLVSERQLVDTLKAQLKDKDTNASSAADRTTELSEKLIKEREGAVSLAQQLAAKETALLEAQKQIATLMAQLEQGSIEVQSKANQRDVLASDVPVNDPPADTSASKQITANQSGEKTLDLEAAAMIVEKAMDDASATTNCSADSEGSGNEPATSQQPKTKTDSIFRNRFGLVDPRPSS